MGKCYLNLSLEIEGMNRKDTWTTSIPGRGNNIHVHHVRGKAREVAAESRGRVVGDEDRELMERGGAEV